MSIFLLVIEYKRIKAGWQVLIHLSKENYIKGDIIDELPERIKNRLNYNGGEELQ